MNNVTVHGNQRGKVVRRCLNGSPFHALRLSEQARSAMLSVGEVEGALGRGAFARICIPDEYVKSTHVATTVFLRGCDV